MTATVVLVHGAFHGGWCWAKVVSGLAARGVTAVAVDLPGHGERAGEPVGDVPGDLAKLNEVLAGLAGPIVLVGHSHGGVVVTEASADNPGVAWLVYLAAVMPDIGEGPGGPPSALGERSAEFDVSRCFTLAPGSAQIAIDPMTGAEYFYQDCSDEDIAFAMARLSPQTSSSFAHVVAAAGWHDRPSTYIVCTEDRTLPPSRQRVYATRASDFVELPTGHSPFFSRPELVVDVLARLADGLA
jgi:pimeloyl-ACP methyl ester carboxylesterase